MYDEPTTSNIATVRELIQRLESKGCVRRKRRQHAHRFSAKVSQDAIAGNELEVLAKKVANG